MEITKTKFPKIKRDFLDTLQINIGYKCNQACSHCHVNSSPSRTEMMSDEIIELIPKVIKANKKKHQSFNFVWQIKKKNNKYILKEIPY